MINKLCKEAHENSKAKGFYDNEKNIGEMIALIHSEVSEALEADRNGKYVDYYLMGVLNAYEGNVAFQEFYKKSIKGSFEEEMADVVIRIFDMCGFKNIDLEAHIKAKMRYNSLREPKHGKKY